MASCTVYPVRVSDEFIQQVKDMRAKEVDRYIAIDDNIIYMFHEVQTEADAHDEFIFR